MVKKFAQVTQRGAAGQSAMNTGKAYNFANMYQLNRSDDQIGKKLGQFTDRANDIKGSMQQANSRSISGGQNNQGIMDQMSSAVERSKGLANDTQNFNPAAQAMKAGNSAYQSGIAGFYAGGAGSDAVQKIRKFGGIYQNVLGQQAAVSGRYNGFTPGVAVQPKSPQQTRQYGNNYSSYDTETTARDAQANNAARGDTQLRSMNDLDWAYKTGRITGDQYDQARRDPAKYRQLMDWLSKQ